MDDFTELEEIYTEVQEIDTKVADLQFKAGQLITRKVYLLNLFMEKYSQLDMRFEFNNDEETDEE